MKLILGLHNLRPEFQNCVATIGNFDGVHLGHQSVLKALVATAKKLNLPTIVILFEPQPKEYFQQHLGPARLTRFREKITAINRLSVDRVLVLPFNQQLADLSPDDFIEKILIQGLYVQYLVVGDDFKFGKNRMGNFQTLSEAGQNYGFTVTNMKTLTLQNTRISSTNIRLALSKGNLTKAAALLGRPYRICGSVAHGNKKGRAIGFPTANIHLHRKVAPLKGVFAVQLYLKKTPDKPLIGVANLGIRPTLNKIHTKADFYSILEVHLFNFNEDIYREYVSVDFLLKIRDEQEFTSFDLLKKQIGKDAAKAMDFFKEF